MIIRYWGFSPSCGRGFRCGVSIFQRFGFCSFKLYKVMIAEWRSLEFHILRRCKVLLAAGLRSEFYLLQNAFRTVLVSFPESRRGVARFALLYISLKRFTLHFSSLQLPQGVGFGVLPRSVRITEGFASISTTCLCCCAYYTSGDPVEALDAGYSGSCRGWV